MRTKYLQELIHFINWKDAAHSLEEFPWDN